MSLPSRVSGEAPGREGCSESGRGVGGLSPLEEGHSPFSTPTHNSSDRALNRDL